MSPKTFREIVARAEAATPGPWCGFNAFKDAHDKSLMHVLRIGTVERTVVDAYGLSSGWEHDLHGTRADFEFILHAREDVPALIAEIKRLKARRK